MTRALGRVIMVPLAFILAALTTLFVIFSLGQERVVQGLCMSLIDRCERNLDRRRTSQTY